MMFGYWIQFCIVWCHFVTMYFSFDKFVCVCITSLAENSSPAVTRVLRLTNTYNVNDSSQDQIFFIKNLLLVYYWLEPFADKEWHYGADPGCSYKKGDDYHSSTFVIPADVSYVDLQMPDTDSKVIHRVTVISSGSGVIRHVLGILSEVSIQFPALAIVLSSAIRLTLNQWTFHGGRRSKLCVKVIIDVWQQ